jgi:hypothetical protein
MKEGIHYIRKAIIGRLTDAVTINGSYVPVYNKVPYDASEPFIKVYSVSSSEDFQNQTSYITDCITNVEVVTAFDGDDGGELQSNQITNQVLQLLRTRSDQYYDLSSDGFNVITCELNNTTYTEEDADDRTYYRAILQMSNRILET